MIRVEFVALGIADRHPKKQGLIAIISSPSQQRLPQRRLLWRGDVGAAWGWAKGDERALRGSFGEQAMMAVARMEVGRWR
jgi:hypothetical protein